VKVVTGIEAIDQLRRTALFGSFDRHIGELWSECEVIRQYLYSFRLENAPSSFIQDYVNDALPRFFHTLKYLPIVRGASVLELGANPYLFTVLLQKFREYELQLGNFFSKNIYESTISTGSQVIHSEAFGESHEFRFTSFNMELNEYPYAADSFDFVLFCEILEHLIIDPLVVFQKIRRVLKPGGRLVLTTPNAVRLINVAHLLSGSNPFDRYHPENGVYGRHNREFTLEELTLLCERNDFDVEVAETLDRYNYDLVPMLRDSYESPGALPYSRERLVALLEQAKAPTVNRGDNLYVVARKR
jgi:SAM-dependent methyltransferase